MVYNEKIFMLVRRLRKKYALYYSGDALLANAQLSAICNSICLLYPFEFWKRFDNDCSKLFQRRFRYKKYLRGMINTFCVYFVTFTFDEHYISLDEKTLFRYIKEYLSVFDDYFVCADYGALNNRLHFHGFVGLDKFKKLSHFVDLKGKNKNKFFALDGLYAYKYGFYSCSAIDSNDSLQALSYAFKASTYAFKSSNNNIKPFHKRGVTHFSLAADSDFF